MEDEEEEEYEYSPPRSSKVLEPISTDQRKSKRVAFRTTVRTGQSSSTSSKLHTTPSDEEEERESISPPPAKKPKSSLHKLPYLKDSSDPRTGKMVTDTANGTVTFTTSYGDNKYKTKETILVFKELINPSSDELTGYECLSCSNTVAPSKRQPYTLKRNREQRTYFHQHFLRFHSNRFKCLLCPDFNSVAGDRQDLLEHLKTRHSIPDFKAYDKVRQKHKNSRIALGSIGKCAICEKPFSDLRTKEYREHRWTHLNQEEKEEAMKRPAFNAAPRWNDSFKPHLNRLFRPVQ